jgi:ABC-type lipoprotein export system ATPase subunit
MEVLPLIPEPLCGSLEFINIHRKSGDYQNASGTQAQRESQLRMLMKKVNRILATDQIALQDPRRVYCPRDPVIFTFRCNNGQQIEAGYAFLVNTQNPNVLEQALRTYFNL